MYLLVYLPNLFPISLPKVSANFAAKLAAKPTLNITTLAALNLVIMARNNPVAAEPHTFSGPLLPPLFSAIPFSFLNLKPILVTRDPNNK